jgi:hypothetical protein
MVTNAQRARPHLAKALKNRMKKICEARFFAPARAAYL